MSKEIKDLLINDAGTQSCIRNIRSQNSDPLRVFTEIVTQNEKAQELIGTNLFLIYNVFLYQRDMQCAFAKSAKRNLY
jgi:hypothetical protein